MDEGMEFEANAAIQETIEFIGVENQFVVKEHDLYSRVLSWHNIIGHLNEIIPTDLDDVHVLNAKIAYMLNKITKLLEKCRFRGLKFNRELQKFLIKL